MHCCSKGNHVDEQYDMCLQQVKCDDVPFIQITVKYHHELLGYYDMLQIIMVMY